MSQRVLGIDLGSYAVKVAELEVGLRTGRLIRLHTLPVAAGPGAPLQRSLEALTQLPPLQPTDVVAVGFPGDRVLLRVLEVPFSEPRKIGAIIGNELADDLPWEMEDVVFDYATLSHPADRALAVVARSEEVAELLKELAARGIDPRAIPPGPLCYASLLREAAAEETVVIADLGHLRSNICVVKEGRAVMARTVFRGGHQITEAFRQTFQLSYVEAEALKEREALLVVEDGEVLAPQRRQMAQITSAALAPLARELRLSLGLFTATLGHLPQRLVLCGGTSLISGIERYLTAELDLPVEQLELASVADFQEAELTREGRAMAALAMGISLEQGGRRKLDLRQGEFAFKTDRSIFTEKIAFLAVSLITILVFAAFNAYMSLHALRKEEAALQQQLKETTRAVLGEAMASPRTVSREVKAGCKSQGVGVSRYTAFDILDMLSREVPPSDRVKLDIARLDIKPGKTYVKGTADSRSAVGDIVEALQKNKCFSKVTSGKILDVSEGKKDFTLTIDSECF